MKGRTKKEQIKRLKAHNPDMAAAEIADKVNCSADWVYETWEPDAGPDDYPEPGTGQPDRETESEPSADLSDIEPEDDDSDDETHPLADMVISDDWDEYECGECGSAVEYLDDECSDCGEGLAWWKA